VPCVRTQLCRTYIHAARFTGGVPVPCEHAILFGAHFCVGQRQAPSLLLLHPLIVYHLL